MGVYVLEFAGEDDRLAALEASTAASDVTPIGPGLATARGIDGVERLAFTRRVADLVGRTDASVAGARALLTAVTLDRSGTVAVRARDVRSTAGVDTQAAERELGSVLVERGLSVDLEDPDHELLALFAGEPDGGLPAVGPSSDREPGPLGGDPTSGGSTFRGSTFGGSTSGSGTGPGASGPGEGDPRTDDGEGVCALGWLAAEPPREFAPAPTERPFFQPGSMDPALARAVANLAGARPGRTVLDPMCGTGGILVEAGLVGADALGTDAQAKMARGAARNLDEYLGDRVAHGTARADATRLPLRDGAVDRAVFDAPYGRQSKVEGRDLAALVGDALREIHRVTGAARAVVVGDRSWAGAAREAGWTVHAAHQRRVHRSLDRHLLVLG